MADSRRGAAEALFEIRLPRAEFLPCTRRILLPQDVVAPYLKNKKDKTFLDRWLLDEDLAGFLEPWRFERLNAVERVLLARRLPKQTASLVRDARERADLIPPDAEDFNRRFDTALQAGGLEADSATIEAVDVVTRDVEIKQLEVLNGMVAGRGGARRGSFGGEFISMGAAAPASVPPDMEMTIASDAVSPIIMKNLAGTRKSKALRQAPDDLTAPPMLDERGVPEEMPAVWNSFYADESLLRSAAERVLQKLDQTREWAENCYQLPIEQQNANLVPASAFWADYAELDGKGPFLSSTSPPPPAISRR